MLDGGQLSGSKLPVADGGIADSAVVLVAGGGFALVELDQPGVTRTRLDSFDQLRPHYKLDFAEAAADALPDSGKFDRLIDQAAVRSEERRVGKECVSTCRSRWSPSHEKKNDNNKEDI